MKQRLIKRLRNLWILELLNAFVIIPGFLFVMSQQIEIGFSTILVMIGVGILLLIGSAFLYLKYQDLKHNTHNLQKYEGVFRMLRWIVPVLLLILLVILWMRFSVETVEDIILRILLYLLAVLEYINYFHIQLMYDNRDDLAYLMKNTRLKQGLMAREFGW